MKSFTIRSSQLINIPRLTNLTRPPKTTSLLQKHPKSTAISTEQSHPVLGLKPMPRISPNHQILSPNFPDSDSRFVIVGAVSIGVVLFLMGIDDQKALALGPEGPLMEEFWENMRRYGLYALTVGTGFAYALVQPIVELLKNPISAILIITIIGGGIFIVSQVLSAMFGVSDFAYEYGY